MYAIPSFAILFFFAGAPVALYGGERAWPEEGHLVGGGRPRVPVGDAHRAGGGVLGEGQRGVLRANARAPGGSPLAQGRIFFFFMLGDTYM